MRLWREQDPKRDLTVVKGGVRNAIRPGDSLTLEQGWAHDAYGPSGRVVLSGSVYITADWNGRELVLRS